MRPRAIHLHSINPGTTSLAKLLRTFCSDGYGIVTAIDAMAVLGLQGLIPEGSDIEVEPFGAFVQSLLSRINVPSLSLVHSGHYTAAVGEACAEAPDDSFLHKSRRHKGLHRRVGDVLKELEQRGLLGGCHGGEFGRIPSQCGEKLKELDKVAAHVAVQLGLLGKESHAAQIERLLASLGTGDLPSKVLVLLDANTSPKQIEVLRWLSEHGVAVTAAFPNHPDPSTPLFQWTAAVSGILGAPQILSEGAPTPVAANLFSRSPSFFTQPNISIRSDPDVMEECERVIGECLMMTASGAPLSSVGVFVRDLESYAPFLHAAAEREGVRLSCPRRIPLLTNSFARLVSEVVTVCSGDDVRGLQILVNSSYSKLKSHQRDEIILSLREAHCERASSWTRAAELISKNMEAPRYIVEIVAWRSEAFAQRRTLQEWLQPFRSLLGIMPKASESQCAARDQRAATAMNRVLQEVASLSRLKEPAFLDLGQFALTCVELWTHSDVSLPVFEGGLTVANSVATLGTRDTIYVMGMLENVFPRRRREDPILNDDDRREISMAFDLEMPLASSYDRQAQEREAFYEVCCGATQNLHCSYPRTSEDRENLPSFFLKELADCRLPPIETFHNSNVRAVATSVADSPVTSTASNSDRAEFSPSTPNEGDAFRPAELKEALQCGFMHYAKRRLMLHKNDFVTHWHHLKTIPVTGHLSISESQTSAEETLNATLEENIEARYGELPPWEVPLLQAGGRRLVREWVSREYASRNSWPKQEGSITPESRFGQELRADMGSGVVLTGRVAAISRLGEYAVVHMVETRAPDLRSGRLEDADALYYGLYLMAISQRATSAAVEVDGMDGKRLLMVIPRLPGTVLPSNTRESLEFRGLDEHEDPFEAKREFYQRVKKLLAVAVARIRTGDIRPRPGDACRWCDYGELCRRSLDFGEEATDFDSTLNSA